jgi:hypothetical protein
MQTSGFFTGSFINQTPLNRFCSTSASIVRILLISKNITTYINVLMPMNWLSDNPMSQHAKPHEWQRHRLGEEDPSNPGRHIGKRVAHAANDKVLKWAGNLHKGTSLRVRDHEAVAQESIG